MDFAVTYQLLSKIFQTQVQCFNLEVHLPQAYIQMKRVASFGFPFSLSFRM